MTAQGGNKNGKSLTELFAEFEDAEDLETSFIKQILKDASKTDPDLPELIRACAIPRWFDAEIVGVLRGDPDNTSENKRFCDLVSGYRFVLSRGEGGFSYHDNTRDALLVDWRATEDKSARFATLNLMLAEFHEDRYAASVESEHYLEDASQAIKRGSARRFRRLSAAVQEEMASTLLDALYHRLLASTEDGFAFFRRSIYELEGSHLAICQSLVSFTRDYLQRLPPHEVDRTLMAWMDYFDTRIRLAAPPYDYEQLEGTLRRLAERDDLPADLQIWALDDLAALYESRLDMNRALRIRLELTNDKADVDVYNAPLRHSALGALYWWLDDREKAIDQYVLAVKWAEELPGARRDTSVTARLDLSLVHAELGNWSAAFEHGTAALCLARAEYAGDRFIQRTVASALMKVLSTCGSRASATALAEWVALEVTPEARRAALLQHVASLTNSGLLRRAQTALDRVSTDTEGRSDESAPDRDVLFRKACLLQRSGQEFEAISVWSRLIDLSAHEPSERLWWVAALNNRGCNRATLGDVAGAQEDLRNALEIARETGFDSYVGEIQIDIANVLRKSGSFLEAQDVLTVVEESITASGREHTAELLSGWGDLKRSTGDWKAARNHYKRALVICRTRKDSVGVAKLLARLISLPSEQSEWSANLVLAEEAVNVYARLARADATLDTEGQRKADRLDADGMRRFCEQTNRAGALDQAHELFRHAAELDAENFWPLLNLSFTCAEQQDWHGATSALKGAMELSPPEMRTSSLQGCLLSYTLHEAEALRSGGDLDAATILVADSLRNPLAQMLPAEDLSEANATQCVFLALTGQTEAARSVYESALALEDLGQEAAIAAGRALGTTMAALLQNVSEWSKLDGALAYTPSDRHITARMTEALAASRTRILSRLDELFGLIEPSPSPSDSRDFLIVTPTAVEIGDAMVPFVDSRQDGGEFLYELIPSMRERILAQTGVTVPGVSMRGSTSLGPNEYFIEIDECCVQRGTIGPDGSYLIRSAIDEPAWPNEGLVDIHPLTGEAGLWAIREHDGADDVESGAILSAPLYLLHRIEIAIRRNLSSYLKTQVAADLIETWKLVDASLVSSILPDERARLRMTWLLRSLVREAIPIVNWRALLSAVREVGGTSARLSDLVRNARLHLRKELPGNQTSRKSILVPDEYQTGLLARLPDPRARHDFSCWLREQLALNGPWITLVTDPSSRLLVSSLTGTEEPIVTVLSSEELLQ